MLDDYHCDMLLKIVTLAFLATLPCLAGTSPLPMPAELAPERPVREACPTGTKMYRNQDIDREVCCYDILCKVGEEPVPCDDRVSHAPTCRSCKEGRFQPARWSLSDKTYNKCRMKKHCDDYQDRGTTYTDATCRCSPNQWLRNDGTCLPRYLCKPGYGQTPSGGCERCTEGQTYSDEDSDTAVCKAVTNCKSHSRCTLKTATIVSDSDCGPKTNDLRSCDIKPTANPMPTKSTLPYQHTTITSQPPPTHGEVTSPNYTAVAVGCSLGGLILIIFVIGICLWLKKHRQQKKYLGIEDRHLEIARSITGMSPVDDIENLRLRVFQIVRKFLEEKYPDQWQDLGRMLLGDAFNATRADLNAHTSSIRESEKMRQVLDTWWERCHTKGPHLEALFRAMYSPKSRKIFQFQPVYDLVIEDLGTTTGVLDTQSFSRHKKNFRFLLPCHKCRNGNDNVTEVACSAERLLGNDNVKNQAETENRIGSLVATRAWEPSVKGENQRVEDVADPPSVLFEGLSEQKVSIV